MNVLSNERQLLLHLSVGNEEAFEEIYAFYSPVLYCKLLKLLKSRFYSKELVQVVFLKIWVNRKSIQSEKSFRSYLFKIATNCAYDFFRKAARDRDLQAQLIKVSPSYYSHIEEDLNNKENFKVLFLAINSLSNKRKIIFQLCKIDGKSYDEVSRLLDISLSTVSDHIVKANLSIRNYMMQASNI